MTTAEQVWPTSIAPNCEQFLRAVATKTEPRFLANYTQTLADLIAWTETRPELALVAANGSGKKVPSAMVVCRCVETGEVFWQASVRGKDCAKLQFCEHWPDAQKSRLQAGLVALELADPAHPDLPALSFRSLWTADRREKLKQLLGRVLEETAATATATVS